MITTAIMAGMMDLCFFGAESVWFVAVGTIVLPSVRVLVGEVVSPKTVVRITIVLVGVGEKLLLSSVNACVDDVSLVVVMVVVFIGCVVVGAGAVVVGGGEQEGGGGNSA